MANTAHTTNTIVSIKRLYLALLSLTIIYGYVGFNTIQYNKTTSALHYLDKLLAVRAFAKNPERADSFLRMSDLPYFFADALNEQSAIEDEFDFRKPKTDSIKRWLEIYDAVRARFPEEPIAYASKMTNVSMRILGLPSCDLAILDGIPWDSFLVATNLYISKTYIIENDKIALLNVEYTCNTFWNDFIVFVFFAQDGDILIGLPESNLHNFPGLSNVKFSEVSAFRQVDQFKKTLPSAISKYINLENKYYIFHMREIEASILNFANSKVGRRYTIDELNLAIEKLYTDERTTAPLLGTAVESGDFIRLAPVVFFVITLTLWRRVRLMSPVILSVDQPWFALDGDDAVGQIIGYATALLPLVAGVFVYVLFANAQGLGLSVFGRHISVEGLVNWEFPKVPAPGWIDPDRWALALLILLPLHMLILMSTSLRLMRIVRANGQRSVVRDRLTTLRNRIAKWLTGTKRTKCE